jgi:hypothetical protein
MTLGTKLLMAYDGNALTFLARVKESIMLSGGFIASMAMSEEATFPQFQTYTPGALASDVLRTDKVVTPERATMHAVFCYGWWDNPANDEDGYWLCKNRCEWYSRPKV